MGGDEEKVLGFERLDGELMEAQIAGLSAQGLELRDLRRMGVEIEGQGSGGRLKLFSLLEDVFPQGMR